MLIFQLQRTSIQKKFISDLKDDRYEGSKSTKKVYNSLLQTALTTKVINQLRDKILFMAIRTTLYFAEYSFSPNWNHAYWNLALGIQRCLKMDPE